MEAHEQPLEVQIELRLRDHEGHKLRHFYQSLSLDDAPLIYNLLLGLVLEALTQEQKGEH